VFCLTFSVGRLGHGADEKTGFHADASTPTWLGLPPTVKIREVSAGSSFNIALSASGAVFAWGAGEFSQLGNNGEDDVGQPQQIMQLPQDFQQEIDQVMKERKSRSRIAAEQKSEKTMKREWKYAVDESTWMAFENACSGRGGIRLKDVPFPTKEALRKQCKEMDSKEVIKAMMLRQYYPPLCHVGVTVLVTCLPFYSGGILTSSFKSMEAAYWQMMKKR